MTNEKASYSTRRVPLAYEHPKMDNESVFIPLLDGGKYWDIIESMEEYRKSILNQEGEHWEALEKAFFGNKQQKFRDEIVVNGESIVPKNPAHLSELVITNLDASEQPDFNDFTPVPTTSPDADKFGYAIYANVEWGTTRGIPASPIFASIDEAESYLEQYLN